jgi:threonine synthase
VPLRSLVNPAIDPGNVAEPSGDAVPFHAALPGYHPTPAHALEAVAGELGLAVARVASWRGLRCRVFLPARSSERRRRAIADEGAEVTVVGVGSLAAAAARFAAATAEPRACVIGVEGLTA